MCTAKFDITRMPQVKCINHLWSHCWSTGQLVWYTVWNVALSTQHAHADRLTVRRQILLYYCIHQNKYTAWNRQPKKCPLYASLLYITESSNKLTSDHDVMSYYKHELARDDGESSREVWDIQALRGGLLWSQAWYVWGWDVHEFDSREHGAIFNTLYLIE